VPANNGTRCLLMHATGRCVSVVVQRCAGFCCTGVLGVGSLRAVGGSPACAVHVMAVVALRYEEHLWCLPRHCVCVMVRTSLGYGWWTGGGGGQSPLSLCVFAAGFPPSHTLPPLPSVAAGCLASLACCFSPLTLGKLTRRSLPLCCRPVGLLCTGPPSFSRGWSFRCSR
jgi:hypothetical protein